MTEVFAYDLFISHAEPDRAWVEGYLLDALAQAGVRVHSEAAFALGRPRLLEFERAIQQSQRTLLVISPAYLADSFEQFTGLLAQSYGLETTTWPVIPLILHPTKLPLRIALLMSINASESADWPKAVEQICKALQHAPPGPASRPACPYPGILPFSEDDSARFFGRAGEVQDLLERLRLHPFLTVIGPSGSGKSSLVFAGLIPALRRSGLFGSGAWLMRTLRPGAEPLAALAAVLGGTTTDLARTAAELLSTQPNVQRLLLVVDQFEELFTVARQDAVPFQHALLQLAATANCYVVLTVRADFYPDLMASPLWRAVQAYRAEVVPLEDTALHEAIMQPAEDVGVYVEAALVERLVADAAGEPGSLPLIQETLVLLWERLERRFLPLQAYEALIMPRRAYGSMRGALPPGLHVALARRADATLAALSPEQQTIARRILLRLVQFGEGRADTRRQQPVAALRIAGDDPLLFEPTLTHLTDNRLLTLSGQEGGAGSQVDMAHEALITGWPTLQAWLAERREAEQTRRRLEAKAAEWVRLGRESGGLLDEAELPEIERWLAGPDAADLGYDADLPRLAQASRAAIEQAAGEREAMRQRELAQAQALATEQRQRAEEQIRTGKRLRVFAAVLAVVSLLALAAAIYARGQQQQADQERGRAEQRTARLLALQSLNHLGDQLDLALLLSLEANRIADLVAAKGSLLAGLVANPQLTAFLRGHTDRVRAVAFSPDGTLLAVGSVDTTIILWDVTTRRPLGPPLARHTGEVRSVMFSPDGKTLASGSADHTIILWDVATRQPLDPPLIGHTNEVKGVAFSPDGTLLASGGNDNKIILWDVVTHQPLGPPLSGHTKPVISVAFSPDGKMLASGSEDATVRLWDVTTRQLIGLPLARHTAVVSSVAFSPDGTMVASAGWDKQIILWDVARRQALDPPLIGHTEQVNSVAFSPDGTTLISGSADKTIILWDVANRRPRDQPPLRGHRGTIWSVAFSSDGHSFASGSADTTSILWNMTERQPLGATLAGHTAAVWGVVWSPDGKTLASGGTDKTIILWDVATRRPLGSSLIGHMAIVTSVAWSPDGTTLASGSCVKIEGNAGCKQGEIRLWDVKTHQMLGLPLINHTNWVRSVAFSPDGKLLASGSADNTIIVWDVATRQPLGPPLTNHTNHVESVAWSPDGKLLASGSADNTIIVWDVATRQPLGPPLSGHTTWVESVVFSSDGTLLASGSNDRTIIVWDVATRQPLGPPLSGHTDTIASMAFSPNSKLLVSGSADKTIILWDVATRQQLGPLLTGHSDNIQSVAFDSDGKTLASGSVDSAIMLWDVDFESWRARACAIAGRNLTLEEWRQNLGDDLYRQTCPNLP